MKIDQINQYMARVGQKVSQARSQLVVPGARDGVNGFNFTAQRILSSAKNLCFSMDGSDCYEPTEALFKGFSDAPGMNDVTNTYGVDVVDISIMATMQSVLPYLAAERAMDKPKDIIYFQKLISKNAAGGFAAGADVVNPFKPLSNNINLGATSGQSLDHVGDATVSTATTITKGSVIVTAYASAAAKTAGTVLAIGKDIQGDGNIYWTKGGAAESASVNYSEGTIAIVAGTTYATNVFDITYDIERSSESGEGDQDHTLKTKPVTESTLITAKNNRIVLESSFEDQAYMNKLTFDLQSTGVSMDYGQRAMKQLLDAYIYYIDLMVIRVVKDAMIKNTTAPVTLDLTGYTLTNSEASTKNDKLHKFMLDLNNSLLKSCSRGATAYLVDMEAASILASDPIHFTPNTNYDLYINGVVGTYKNIPVIRHYALNNILDAGGSSYGFIGAIHKTPDGQVAPVVYGEYLPPLTNAA